jgi:hypothetical protein
MGDIVMTRMGRDFSLVLLGASILTAGYFMVASPEAEMEAKADEQAAERVGGGERDSSGRYHYRPGFAMIYVHSSSYGGGASGRSPAVGGVSRGGFGGVGRSAGIGG